MLKIMVKLIGAVARAFTFTSILIEFCLETMAEATIGLELFQTGTTLKVVRMTLQHITSYPVSNQRLP